MMKRFRGLQDPFYGQIAKLIGRDKNARLVGKVLSMAQYYGD